jgi:hypothetical protein
MNTSGSSRIVTDGAQFEPCERMISDLASGAGHPNKPEVLQRDPASHRLVYEKQSTEIVE